jgi:membrane-associated phospholipid phosphatase
MKLKKSIKNNHDIFLTVGALIFGLVLLGIIVNKSVFSGVDLTISRAVQSIRSPLFSTTMNVVSEIGDDFNLEIIIVLAMSLLYFAGLKVEAIKTVLLTASAATVGSLTKTLVNRPRPGSGQVFIQETLSDKSFPSLHVLIFTVFFGYMLYLSIYKIKARRLKILIALPSIFLILTIGISRIYLGAHWASDTIGGYLMGALFLFFAVKMSGKSSNQTT